MEFAPLFSVSLVFINPKNNAGKKSLVLIVGLIVSWQGVVRNLVLTIKCLKFEDASGLQLSSHVEVVSTQPVKGGKINYSHGSLFVAFLFCLFVLVGNRTSKG